MNVRFRRARQLVLATAAIAATIAAATVINPHDAARADIVLNDETVTTQQVMQALDNVPNGLVREAVTATPPGAASVDIAASVPLTLDIPADASRGVDLTAGDFSFSIGLPNAVDAGTAQHTAEGAVAYPSEGDSANAVVPVSGGVQLLSVIGSQDAPEHYAYPLTLPEGFALTAAPDGGAQVVDSQGTAAVAFEPAWAKDAAGESVPTHYEVEGNTLTQVVEHRSATGVSYPVVADPLPVILIVVTAAAAIVVVAAALGVATWVALNWWNYCRARGQYPQLSTRGGFTARCVS